MTSAFNPINPMGFGSSVGFGFGMHRIVPVMVILIFVIVFVGIFIVIVQGISQWNESGDRMELHLSGQEYGLLIEGDRGNLTFQGTRYLGFERLSF